jgi:hypothetical protein
LLGIPVSRRAIYRVDSGVSIQPQIDSLMSPDRPTLHTWRADASREFPLTTVR